MVSEELLIESLQKGQAQAYSRLYDQYAVNLYNIILKVVKSESEAESLLQDSFVKIWKNISQYDSSKGRLFTWLVTIARNVAIDYCRSSYFIKKNLIQNESNYVDNKKLSSEMFELDYLGIDKIVNSLDDKLKHIIDLQFYYGYTQAEIAEEFSIPLGTVKSRTRAALLQLRNKLTE
ncbi:MAG: sigma-70 family RNA polymerase sigma factor [Saprospiraceae bacterium]